MKYSGEYVEEDNTKIKFEPASVKTEPFNQEYVKVDVTNSKFKFKFKFEPMSVKTEPFIKAESFGTVPVRAEQKDDPDDPPVISATKVTSTLRPSARGPEAGHNEGGPRASHLCHRARQEIY